MRLCGIFMFKLGTTNRVVKNTKPVNTTIMPYVTQRLCLCLDKKSVVIKFTIKIVIEDNT